MLVFLRKCRLADVLSWPQSAVLISLPREVIKERIIGQIESLLYAH